MSSPILWFDPDGRQNIGLMDATVGEPGVIRPPWVGPPPPEWQPSRLPSITPSIRPYTPFPGGVTSSPTSTPATVETGDLLVYTSPAWLKYLKWLSLRVSAVGSALLFVRSCPGDSRHSEPATGKKPKDCVEFDNAHDARVQAAFRPPGMTEKQWREYHRRLHQQLMKLKALRRRLTGKEVDTCVQPDGSVWWRAKGGGDDSWSDSERGIELD